VSSERRDVSVLSEVAAATLWRHVVEGVEQVNLLRALVGGARSRLAALIYAVRRPPIEVRVPTVHHGTAYGGWTMCPAVLTENSVVYSFGVGEDISFDLSLIEHYGLSVHAFDPTPKVVTWVRSQRLPDRFHLHDYGVADYDGTATFYPPENPAHVSHTMLAPARSTGQPITVPVRRLGSIMRELGHHRVDVLKLDVEGAEYAVIADILRSEVEVGQWLVEFHHRFPGVGWKRTEEAIRLLRSHSFGVFAVSKRGNEYSFLRR